MLIDIGSIQKEISALEELSRQLFLEYVDMHGVKVYMLLLSLCFVCMFGAYGFSV